MNKNIFLLVVGLIFTDILSGQVICVNCYNQNNPISSSVNNLLLNGSLESVTCPPMTPNKYICPHYVNYNCDVINWTCSGGGTGTYAKIVDNTFSIVPDGIHTVYFGNLYANLCSAIQGDLSCLIDTLCSVIGIPLGYPQSDLNYGGASGVSLSQTVNGLIPGNTYVLEFWAGGESDSWNFPNQGIFAVDVGFGDTLLRENPTEPITGIGTRYIIQFIATSTSHTIKFTNWGHCGPDETELVLDDVRLYTLAELSSIIPSCIYNIIEKHENYSVNINFKTETNELEILTNETQLFEITVYDIFSRKIFQQQFKNSTNINLDQFSNGVYLYELRNKKDIIRKGKILKKNQN